MLLSSSANVDCDFERMITMKVVRICNITDQNKRTQVLSNSILREGRFQRNILVDNVFDDSL